MENPKTITLSQHDWETINAMLNETARRQTEFMNDTEIDFMIENHENSYYDWLTNTKNQIEKQLNETALEPTKEINYMTQPDELAKTVQVICNRYNNSTDQYVLEDPMEFNDIVDDIFDGFDQDYADGNFNRAITTDEKAAILDALCTMYSVKNMSQEEINDNLFSEYID